MVFFSVFKKHNPEEIYQSLAKKIVVSALRYRQEIEAPDNKRSADAGAELIYLLLHLVDRLAFAQLGATQRNEVFDEVSKIAAADYAGAIFNANTPQDVIINNAEQIMSTLNSRQAVYAGCQSLTGEIFPGKGTMIFAFSFFVHRALGNTDRTNVNKILSGETDLNESDMNDFPNVSEIMTTAITVSSILKELKIPDVLKKLK